MSRLFRRRPASPGGGGALLGIVCFLCLMAALCFPSLPKAADDWLKVEEEKPLFGESAPKAKPAPAPGESAPQADLQKQAEAMKRYLKRFRDAINEAAKLLDKREALVGDLEGKCKAFEAVYKQYGTKAREMIEDAWQQLKKYDPLVKTDPRFKFQDPGRDPGFKTRGDKLIENGGQAVRNGPQMGQEQRQAGKGPVKG